MSRTLIRLGIISLIAVLIAVPALTAAAVEEEGGAGEEATSTTVVATFGDYTPAVVIDPAAPDEVDQPWTTKFLVPTGVALAAVAVFATVVQYFLRVVRSRYKVVE